MHATVMTSPSFCRCSTGCRRYAASPAGRAEGLTDSAPTVATTTTSTAASCDDAESHRRSPAAEPCTAPALAATAGSSSGHSAWLHQFKRLLVRYDRRHDIHEAFLALGCCLVCFRRLQNSF
jgi:hypothetical protein